MVNKKKSGLKKNPIKRIKRKSSINNGSVKKILRKKSNPEKCIEKKNSIKPSKKIKVVKTKTGVKKHNSIIRSQSHKTKANNIVKVKAWTPNKNLDRICSLERELDAIKEECAKLHEENLKDGKKIGTIMAENAQFRLQADAMLGQILKGLYLLGFGPEDIQAKCQQMFMKKVVAD